MHLVADESFVAESNYAQELQIRGVSLRASHCVVV
jgi:hypothetical protein